MLPEFNTHVARYIYTNSSTKNRREMEIHDIYFFSCNKVNIIQRQTMKSKYVYCKSWNNNYTHTQN